jgi:hypothetical protein
MINKLYSWVGKNAMVLVIAAIVLSCCVTIYSLVDIVRKPPSLKNYGNGVQNHLVWSNKGECYFVRPYSGDVVYLIRVGDCDKK